MASHRVAIAKATFAASLLRPDPNTQSLTRDDAAQFDNLLNGAIIQCSPSNVQACRVWLCHNILPSSNRLAALGKFLTSLSDSYKAEEKFATQDGNVSARRMRLHLLYIIHDVLHWAKFHNRHTTFDSIAAPLLAITTQLLCSSANRDNTSHQHRLLSNLLSVWQEGRYFSENENAELRSAFQKARAAGDKEDTVSTKDAETAVAKEVPWTMPPTHGDPLTPYYDLPAANMMPLIAPNASDPIDTHRMKALRLSEGSADPSLIAIVKDFLLSAGKIYDSIDEVDTTIHDVDAMGQEIITDELGEPTNNETYYGWSRNFCEKLRKRQANGGLAGNNRGRAASRSNSNYSRRSSRSLSRSRSRTRRKRRRSLSDSRSRSRSRVRRRSRYSSSRSRSRSRAEERYSSRSPRPRNLGHGDTGTRPFARSLQHVAPLQNFQQQQQHHLPPPPPPPPLGMPLPRGMIPLGMPIPLPPLGLSQNGLPVPPPKPPGWQGAWPPPPPPLPMASSFNMPLPPGANNLNSQTALPVPPPPGQWNMQAGRGNNHIDRNRDPRRHR